LEQKVNKKLKITILGAGSWGTALAILLVENKHNVILWDFFEENIENIKKYGENKKFLPGIKIDKRIILQTNIEKSLQKTDVVIFAIPSHVIRNIVKLSKQFINKNMIIVNVAKGIENKTLLRMSEVIISELGKEYKNNIVTLSGPSHAEEVSRKIPTTIVATGYNENTAKIIQKTFSNKNFRIYTNCDIIGVELGGALKNIIAIAAGISDGLGFGDNTKSAIMTRGLAEITRLGVKMGANPLTFSGLSGMGDLITTCISRFSRNRGLGERIGRGETLKDILSTMIMVAEGVRTCISAYCLSKKYNVEMPITKEVYKILFKNKKPIKGVYDLMLRELKSETEFCN